MLLLLAQGILTFERKNIVESNNCHYVPTFDAYVQNEHLLNPSLRQSNLSQNMS